MAIGKGDLVAIVKPSLCCGNTDAVGVTFIVRVIKPGPSHCFHCGARWKSFDAQRSDGIWCRVERLQKLRPPAFTDTLPAYHPSEAGA